MILFLIEHPHKAHELIESQDTRDTAHFTRDMLANCFPEARVTIYGGF